MMFQMQLENSEKSHIIFLLEAKNVIAKTGTFQLILLY